MAVDRVADKRYDLGAEGFAAYAFLVLGMLAYHAPEAVTFVMDRADEQLSDVEGMTAARVRPEGIEPPTTPV